MTVDISALVSGNVLPSKRDYATAKSQFQNANSKASAVLLAVVRAGAWEISGIEDATPQQVFADFLGEMTLPGKSEVRNEIIVRLAAMENDETGKPFSQKEIADMLNMSKAGVEYVIKKSRDELPESKKSKAVTAGDESGESDAGESTPKGDDSKASEPRPMTLDDAVGFLVANKGALTAEHILVLHEILPAATADDLPKQTARKPRTRKPAASKTTGK